MGQNDLCLKILFKKISKALYTICHIHSLEGIRCENIQETIIRPSTVVNQKGETVKDFFFFFFFFFDVLNLAKI